MTGNVFCKTNSLWQLVHLFTLNVNIQQVNPFRIIYGLSFSFTLKLCHLASSWVHLIIYQSLLLFHRWITQQVLLWWQLRLPETKWRAWKFWKVSLKRKIKKLLTSNRAIPIMGELTQPNHPSILKTIQLTITQGNPTKWLLYGNKLLRTPKTYTKKN